MLLICLTRRAWIHDSIGLVLLLVGGAIWRVILHYTHPLLEDIALVRADGSSVCAATEDGTIYCWGSMPLECDSFERTWTSGSCRSWIAPVEAGKIHGLVDMAVSFRAMCAVDDAGGVYCLGRNDHGEISPGDAEVGGAATMRKLDLPEPAVSVSTLPVVGSCVTYRSGAVDCWGGMFSVSPTRYFESGVVEAQVASGRVCARTRTGAVVCKMTGQPGEEQPVSFAGSVVAMTAGAFAICGVAATGEASCLPYPHASPDDILRGKPLVGDSIAHDAVDVGIDTGVACVVTKGGEIQCWGKSLPGAFGTRDSESAISKEQPQTVLAIHDATQIAVMATGACARLGDGRLSCFGIAGSGARGIGLEPTESRARLVIAPLDREKARMPEDTLEPTHRGAAQPSAMVD